MKTIEKEKIETKESEVKQEFTLEEAFVLWRNTTKTGKHVLKGYDLHKNKLVGFFNTNKTNPKQPDVRICEVTMGEDGKETTGNEICSLWENQSNKGKRYLTGSTDEKEAIVAFYGKESEENKPYIRAYFKENK